MSKRAAPATTKSPTRGKADHSSTAIRLIAGLLVLGAAWMLAGILVPFMLAIVLAIAVGPVVGWMERKGVPNTLGSLICLFALLAALCVAGGLLVYQAGTMLGQSDHYINQVSNVIASASNRLGGDRLMQSLGFMQASADDEARTPSTDPDTVGPPAPPSLDEGDGTSSTKPAETADSGSADRRAGGRYWSGLLRKNLRTLAEWVASGLGGVLGLLAATVIFLAFFFYMLQGRAHWYDRITRAMSLIGMEPKGDELRQSQKELETFVGFVSLVALSYAILTTIVYSLIGLPTPILWGILTGLLEFIPFFGPMIAGLLITAVSITLGTLWQPLSVVGLFLVLHLVEGYIITPIVYGKAVKIDPVTCLLGVMLFGWIWGPIGSMLAMPMMILLRGLISITPGTPALDALADVEE